MHLLVLKFIDLCLLHELIEMNLNGVVRGLYKHMSNGYRNTYVDLALKILPDFCGCFLS